MQLKIRCLQLDLARQKETIEYVCSLIDYAYECGYNYVMIYFENYIITSKTAFFDKKECYTKEEIKSIVEYAKKSGIEIIPSVQNLSYLTNIFKYKQFDGLRESFGRFGDKSNTGCINNPDFVSFIDEYIEEVLDMFNGEYVNMGFDEQFDFALCDKCIEQALKDKTKDKMFLNYIVHTNNIVRKHNKKMMMWDDWFEYSDVINELPKDIILINWNYVYFSGEPKGHWTNRVKKDVFAIYDKAGFKYLFATWLRNASSTFNTDTFTNYAKRYNPYGAVATTWELNDRFYNGIMPLIKYSGYLWSGKILTEQDKTTCFAEFFDNDAELAKRILNYNYFEVLPNLELTKKCIEDNLSLCFVRGATEQFLHDIKAKLNNFVGQKRDSLLEIYYTVLENFLNMKLCKISEVVFDNYVSKEDSSEIIKNLQDIKNDYQYIYNCYKSLWEKYRKGILSKNDGLNEKYSHIIASIDNSINELDKKVKKGVVYVDICMPEQYNTVRNEIVIKYKNGIKKQEFDGSLKSDDVLMENTGSYTVRIAIDNEEIEELFFYSYREGASYLQCVKAFVKGVKYIPEKVSVVCGIVEKAENVLREDSMFCELGEADGKKHYFDFELSKQKHGIKIKFKPV